MKLDTASDEFTVQGREVQEQEMTVKNTSKLFSLMIDGLYQDKHGSVIRELSANAIDVHKSAKVERPFEITIPNGIVNNFMIRDFGNGLSKDEIVKYFGTLLESSKDNENESIGAFGLGCKSPFSLVNEFSVTSIKNGKKSTVLFIRENFGTPKFFVIYEGETDEESGTSIFFEDKSENSHTKWIDAVERQLCALDVKPIIHNYDNVNYPEIVKWGGIGYVKPRELPNKNYICMGQILYPINLNDFTDDDIKFINSNHTVIYYCGIGDITVPPDRERVEISAKTVETLKRIAEHNHETIADILGQQFEKDYDGKYTTIKQFIYDNIFIGIDVKETINKYINLEKYIGEDNLKWFKSKINYNYAKDDLAILTNNFSGHKSIFMDQRMCIYQRNGKEIELTSGTFISLENIFNAKDIPIYLTNNARVGDLKNLMIKNGLLNAKMLRARFKELQSLEKFLKAAAPMFNYDPNNIHFIHKENGVKFGNPFTATPVKKYKIKIKGLKMRCSAYDYSYPNSEYIDALLGDEPVIFLKKKYKQYNDENISENEINQIMDKGKVKVFLADYEQYNTYIGRDNVYTFKDYVEKFIMSDSNYIADIVYNKVYNSPIYKNSMFKDRYNEIISDPTIIDRLYSTKMKEIMGDKKEITLGELHEKIQILSNTYLPCLKDVIIDHNRTSEIVSEFIKKRMS